MKNQNITSPEHWEEWFEKCALQKCGREAREKLSVFAYSRYKKYLSKALNELRKKQKHVDTCAEVNDLIGPGSGEIPPNGIGRCWHDLEASVWHKDKPTETNKSYKKFYRAHATSTERQFGTKEAVKYLEGSTTKFLIQSRCRKLLTGVVLADQDHNPDDDEEDQEEISVNESKDLAKKVFVSLDDDEKFFILAYYKELNLSSNLITDHFNRQKSALYERQKRIVRSLKEKIIHTDSEIEEDYRAILGVITGLTQLLEEWKIQPECPTGHLFK